MARSRPFWEEQRFQELKKQFGTSFAFHGLGAEGISIGGSQIVKHDPNFQMVETAMERFADGRVIW